MIRNCDIEKFYSRIDKQVSLAAEYINDKSFINIIKSCRLKPYSYFMNNTHPKNIMFEALWVDEFGNSIGLKENKVKINLDDPNIKNTQSSTDLFYGNSVNKIGDQSQKVIYCIDNSESPVVFLGFFGSDEYFRCFICEGENINRISPLLLDVKSLDKIITYSRINYTKEFSQEDIHFNIPFEVKKCLLFDWKDRDSIGLNLKSITGEIK
jgi:hypothetical protein